MDLNLAVNLLGKDQGGLGLLKSMDQSIKGVGSTLGDVGKMVAGFAIGGLLTQAPAALLDMAKSASADEQATARLSQSIKNLGGNVDANLKSVNAAIAGGQKLAFTDDQVRDSYQFLAAATGSSDEAITRQSAAMDLARGANIPLSQATKMLGKLNSDNVEVFKKLGITLGDNATEADALAAVQTKFAGQADAYAQSTAGQFEQAQIAMDEIQEGIGTALLPVLAKVGQFVADNLPAIQEMIGGIASGIADTLVPMIEDAVNAIQVGFKAILPTLRPLIDVLPSIGTAISQAFSFFTTGAGDIEAFRGMLNRLIGNEGAQAVITVFTNMVGFFQGVVLPMLQGLAQGWQKVFAGDLPGALEIFSKTLADYTLGLAETLAGWGQAFITWVAPMIPPLLVELGKLYIQLEIWLATVALPAIAEKLLEWGQAFIAWVAPLIPPLLLELGRLYLEMQTWMVTVALPAIASKLLEWGQAFVAWVGPQIPPLLVELAKLLGELGSWMISTALPAILSKLGEWALAFTAWIAPRIIPMLLELSNLLSELTNWVIKVALPAIADKLLEWGGAFLGFVAKDVIPFLWDRMGAIRDKINGWIAGAVKGIASEMGKIGTAMIDGVISGIQGSAKSLQNAASSAVNSAWQAAKDAIGWHSPAAKFVPLGEAMMDGTAVGVQSRLPVLSGVVNDGMAAVGDDAIEPARQSGNQAGTAWAEGFTEGTQSATADPGGRGGGRGGSSEPPNNDGQLAPGQFQSDPLYQKLVANKNWSGNVPGKLSMDFGNGISYNAEMDTERAHKKHPGKSAYYSVMYRVNTLLSNGQASSVEDAFQKAVAWVIENTPAQYRAGLGWTMTAGAGTGAGADVDYGAMTDAQLDTLIDSGSMAPGLIAEVRKRAPVGYGGFRARGGAVAAGMAYTVGESGPETLYMGRQSGWVAPNGGGGIDYEKLAACLASQPIIMQMNGQEVGRVVRAEIQRYLRRNASATLAGT